VEISRAFLAAAKSLHPDSAASRGSSPAAALSPGSAPQRAPPNSVARFTAVKEAYDVLRSEAIRRAYDRQLSAGGAPRAVVVAPLDPAAAARLRVRATRFDRLFRSLSRGSGGALGWRMPAVTPPQRAAAALAAAALAATASWCLVAWLGNGEELYERGRGRGR